MSCVGVKCENLSPLSRHARQDTLDNTSHPSDRRGPQQQARCLHRSRCANPVARGRVGRLLVHRQRWRGRLHDVRQVLLDRGHGAHQSRQSSDGPSDAVAYHLSRKRLFPGRAGRRGILRVAACLRGHYRPRCLDRTRRDHPSGPQRRHRRGGRGRCRGDQERRTLCDRCRQPGARHSPALSCCRGAPSRALAWWDWDHDRLRAALPDFRRLSIEDFLEKYAPASMQRSSKVSTPKRYTSPTSRSKSHQSRHRREQTARS